MFLQFESHIRKYTERLFEYLYIEKYFIKFTFDSEDLLDVYMLAIFLTPCETRLTNNASDGRHSGARFFNVLYSTKFSAVLKALGQLQMEMQNSRDLLVDGN